VHIVFGTTLEEIVEMLRLSPAIRNALLQESGDLGTLLALARAAERGEAEAIDVCCEHLKTLYPDQGLQFDLAHIGEMSLASAAWISAHARA
jgi:c-di-GMP-related signal transduction protein